MLRRKNNDVLPAAPLQTKHGRASGFPSALSSPPLPSSPLHFFLFSSSFLRGKWEEEAKRGRTPELWKLVLSQPRREHHSSSGWRLCWCLSLSLSASTFTTPRTHFFCSSSSLQLCPAAFLPEELQQRQPAEFNREDNVHWSSLQSIYISRSAFCPSVTRQ